jgi:hypothetical protein
MLTRPVDEFVDALRSAMTSSTRPSPEETRAVHVGRIVAFWLADDRIRCAHCNERPFTTSGRRVGWSSDTERWARDHARCFVVAS